MRRRFPRRGAVAAAAIALLLSSCVREVGQPATATSTPSREPRELVVFAGPSLSSAFEEIVGDFVFVNEDVDVSLTIRPSDELADDLQRGATADVFASDDAAAMNRVSLDVGVEMRTDLVRNRIVVVVPPDNPAEISEFEDIAAPGVRVALPTADVPASQAAMDAIVAAGLETEVLPNVLRPGGVPSVLEAVTDGVADAGIVYASDVSLAADSDLASVPIPEEFAEDLVYPIAMIPTSPHPDVAERFIAWLSTANGIAVLEDYGFEPIE